MAKHPMPWHPSEKPENTAEAAYGEQDMPKGPNGQTRPADAIGLAVHIAKIATGEVDDTELKQPAKRASGIAGAKARQQNTTAEQRADIARAAASARWK